jgi:transcriptional regulator GlxA family with amidase domain
MHYSDQVKNIKKSSLKALTSRHHEIINLLEQMLEKGIPDLTMSELASKLKISLRKIYLTTLTQTKWWH